MTSGIIDGTEVEEIRSRILTIVLFTAVLRVIKLIILICLVGILYRLWGRRHIDPETENRAPNEVQGEARRMVEKKESGEKAAWFGFNEQFPAEYRRIRKMNWHIIIQRQSSCS